MIKTQKKKIIALLFKQGSILEKFKETPNLFETVHLSMFPIFFEINLYKFVKKYPRLKHSKLSEYLKNNFIKIQPLCEEMRINSFNSFLN